jgi:hypothetical protein
MPINGELTKQIVIYLSKALPFNIEAPQGTIPKALG